MTRSSGDKDEKESDFLVVVDVRHAALFRP
jgi:hypothetical protein